MTLSEYDKVIGTYKMYISDFFISVTLGQVIFVTSPLIAVFTTHYIWYPIWYQIWYQMTSFGTKSGTKSGTKFCIRLSSKQLSQNIFSPR